MKRQRGRNRGGGQQGKPQQNANRAFESNGPDNVKIRGNSQHVFERYQQLARDAGSAGDRVLAENYLQHAEHYFRLIRTLQPNRTTAEIVGRETYTSGFDIDFEDESGAQAEPEIQESQEDDSGQNNQGNNQGQGQQRQDRYDNRPRDDRQQRDDRPRDDRPQQDRPRDDRPPRDRDRDRNFNDRPRDDRQQRDDRPREDRPRDDRPRDDRSRDDRPQLQDRPPREDRPQRDRNFNRDRDRDRPYRDDRAAEPAAVEAAPEPVAAPAPAAVLRSEDGDSSHMPAFLQAKAPRAEAAETAGEETPRPRRRRAPRATEAAGADES